MRVRALLALTVLLAAAAAVGTGTALAHDDPCHARLTCPADDHEYAWSGMSCTSDPAARRPDDQLPIDDGGVRYWCHVVVDLGMVPRQPTPAACGGDRLAALAVAVPYARPARSTIAAMRRLRRPSATPPRLAVSGDRYTVRASLVSMRRAPAGLVVVLRGSGSGRVRTVIPRSSCAAVGAKGIAPRTAGARSAIERACGTAPASGAAVALRGTATVTGLPAWRASSVERGAVELAAVTSFAARRCAAVR